MILDTSFLIDLMKGEEKAIEKVRELEEEGENQSVTSVTLFELWSGIQQSDLPDQERQKVMEVTGDRVVYDLDPEAGKRAGKIDGKLVKEGKTVDPEDSMIGAIAIENDETVLTGNQEHFERISEITDLKMEKH
ncbi:MAG: type II toxin-antitoxin system VapC family toxin [Candidatus Nanohaloarchaea archaeon]